MDTLETVQNIYLGYLWQRVKEPDEDKTYDSLFKVLQGIPFYYTIEKDANRVQDALQIRQEFYDSLKRYVINNSNGKQAPKPMSELGLTGAPSFLEVMVGLATRMEHDILMDDAYGDRTSKWFWMMMHNLGLDVMYDTSKIFHSGKIRKTVQKVMDRDYPETGLLFPLSKDKVMWPNVGDQRNVELWYQAMYWIEEEKLA